MTVLAGVDGCPTGWPCIPDAFAALWTAERAAAGRALVLPVTPPVDSCGLRKEIVV